MSISVTQMIATINIIGVTELEPQLLHFFIFKCVSLTIKQLEKNKKNEMIGIKKR
jgi:hypothetical protein